MPARNSCFFVDFYFHLVTLLIFFEGQDVDLRSLDPRSADPRLSRIVDQDMRTISGQLPNPLPPVGDR